MLLLYINTKKGQNNFRNHESKSVFYHAELSSTLMEKMQAQEMMSGLRIPEMDELGQFFRSLPTSTLVGIGALTAVLAYWLATRPRPIKPPCSLLHQSEEVPVRWSTHTDVCTCMHKYIRVSFTNAVNILEMLHTYLHTQVDKLHLISQNSYFCAPQFSSFSLITHTLI